MADKVRIGVISTSWWVDMYHLPSLTSHPWAEVVAITPSLYDGWKAQQVVDAALKSHATGCWARV